MKKILTSIAVVVLTGCSTMINGTDQTIKISGPKYIPDLYNAKVEIKSDTLTYTRSLPAQISVYPESKKLPLTITTVSDCLIDESITIRKELASAYWLNVFNGFGFFVDYATGAMWQYPEETLFHVQRRDLCEEITANL